MELCDGKNSKELRFTVSRCTGGRFIFSQHSLKAKGPFRELPCTGSLVTEQMIVMGNLWTIIGSVKFEKKKEASQLS